MRTTRAAARRTLRITMLLSALIMLTGLIAGLAVPAAEAGRSASLHRPGRLPGLNGRREPARLYLPTGPVRGAWPARSRLRTWGGLAGPLGALSRRWGAVPGRWGGTTTPASPWRVLPTANPVMPNGTLVADSCISPTSCTAVGAYEDDFGTELPLAERLNRTRWAVQPTPSPAGSLWTSLFGVSCASPRACVAVGYYATSAGSLLGFAERWNGTRWVLQLTPDPPGSKGSGLFAISCPAARSCVATGLYSTRAGIIAPLAELWNGVRWRALPAPVPAAGKGAEFVAVSCSAADACTAAGDYVTSAGVDLTLAERLTPAGWTLQTTPNPANSFDSELSGISCTSAHACTAAGGYAIDVEGDAEPLAEAWNGTTWHLQATPFLPQPTGAHGGGGAFSAVSCTTPDACVAVGTYLKLGKQEINQASLVERWNGTRWRVQASPNPATSRGTALSGISCPAAATCIATGSYPVVEPVATIEGTVRPTQTIAEVWHGTRWRIQSTANRSGATVDDDLSAVSCTSPTTCTAVGSYADPSGNLQLLADAERWSGAWAVEPSPRLAGFFDPELDDVSCTSQRACTAVGSDTNAAFDSFALAERWNGAHWALQPSSRLAGAKNAQLFAVSCPTVRACTAVGASGKNVPLTERWDGARWSAQPSPRPAGTGGSELIGVSCASAHACTAVGEFAAGDKREQTLAEQWNGTRWTIKPTPNPARAPFAELDDVSCSSADRCTAIGVSELSNGTQRTLAERWNGARWTIQPTPNRAAGAFLNSVSCPSAQACTAVGLYHLANGATWMLVESWNGSRWSIEPTPALNAYDSGLAWVSCTRPRTCTAVGFYFGLTGFSLNLAITR